MASLNKAIIIGHLGADPETRYTSSGDAVCTIRVATSESWKDKNGEKQERTEWHTVTLWKRLGEIANEYLKKGSQVYIEGRIQTEEYEKDGQKRYATKIVASEMKMLGGRDGDSKSSRESDGYREPPKRQPKPAAGAQKFDDLGDDIPF